MRPYDIKAEMAKLRALLILGALVSLCLSDSVGPRLMPLPVSEVVAASAGAKLCDEFAASRAPSSTKGLITRMEMAATAQNRASARHQQMQTATHAAQGMFEAPAVSILKIHGAYAPLFSFATPVLRPPGRAPPRLV